VLSSVTVNVDAVTVSADAVAINARGSINAVAVCTCGLVAASRLWAAMTAGRLWAAMPAGRLRATMAAAKTAEAARDPVDHVIAPCHSHHRSGRRSARRDKREVQD
jgi:hypothetical protein